MHLIYHITHLENLASIVEAGGIWSDAAGVVLLNRGQP